MRDAEKTIGNLIDKQSVAFISQLMKKVSLIPKPCYHHV